MDKKVTLADIAKQAGVSKQTVSRVINNREDVSYETRTRVQEIIDRVGYRPNALARSLSAKQSFTIGVMLSRLEYYGPRAMFAAIDTHAYEAGYRVIPYIVHEDNPSNIEDHLRNLIALQPDGIIWEIAGTTESELWLHDTQLAASLPIITMDTKLKGSHNVVEVQNVTSAAGAVQHLIDQGYRNIGIITGPANWRSSLQRLEGWKRALQENGLLRSEEQIVEGDWSVESGKRGILKLIEQFPALDAVFVCNDQMALGVLSELNNLGIQIPQEIGVVGYDGIEEAPYFTPPLTTVRQPFDLYAKEMVRMLISMIEENVRYKSFTLPEPVKISPQLMIRKSSLRNAE